jgi:hypothetical protein
MATLIIPTPIKLRGCSQGNPNLSLLSQSLSISLILSLSAVVTEALAGALSGRSSIPTTPSSERHTGRNTSPCSSSGRSFASRGGRSREYFTVPLYRSSPEFMAMPSTSMIIDFIESSINLRVTICLFRAHLSVLV